MTALLADVAGVLERRVSSFAVVGAAALAVRGVSRSTLDLDIADREGLAHTVTERLVDLPTRCRKLWERVRAE